MASSSKEFTALITKTETAAQTISFENLRFEKLNAEEGNTVTFDQVIAVSDNALKVGNDRRSLY